MSDVKVNDVVVVRTLVIRTYRVERVFPSFEEGTLLYRIQELKSDGKAHPIRKPINVTRSQIRKNLGGYEAWLMQKED